MNNEPKDLTLEEIEAKENALKVDRRAFPCPECNGTGIKDNELCLNCRGAGKVMYITD